MPTVQDHAQNAVEKILEIPNETETILGILQESTSHDDAEAIRREIAQDLQTRGLFDLLACRVQEALQSDPIRQSEDFGDGITAQTVVRMTGAEIGPARNALFEEPWTWWHRGKVQKFQLRDDGSASFVLRPIWPNLFFVAVGLDVSAPEESQESAEGVVRRKLVVKTKISASFDGVGGMELIELPDGCVVRSDWTKVRPVGIPAFLPIEKVGANHVGAESGRMPFPYPKGTGFPGLIARLKS